MFASPVLVVFLAAFTSVPVADGEPITEHDMKEAFDRHSSNGRLGLGAWRRWYTEKGLDESCGDDFGSQRVDETDTIIFDGFKTMIKNIGEENASKLFKD